MLRYYCYKRFTFWYITHNIYRLIPGLAAKAFVVMLDLLYLFDVGLTFTAIFFANTYILLYDCGYVFISKAFTELLKSKDQFH